MDSKLKRDLILDNYQNAANRGIPDDDKYKVVNSKNDSCVDNIDVAARVANKKIEDVKFDGEACAICTSCASVMTKELHGKSIAEAQNIIENFDKMINELPYDEDVLGELNIYNEVYKQPSRKKCALLPIKAIGKIIEEEK
jgi:nitrogen fixation NifU-like protein